MQREREIEGERAASCWYSSAAAVPDEAAIFTHSPAFFSAGILSRRRASAPVRLFLNVLFVNVPEHDCSCHLACKGGCSGPVFIHLFCAFNNVHANKLLMLTEVSSTGGFHSVAACMHLHGLSQI